MDDKLIKRYFLIIIITKKKKEAYESRVPREARPDGCWGHRGPAMDGIFKLQARSLGAIQEK